MNIPSWVTLDLPSEEISITTPVVNKTTSFVFAFKSYTPTDDKVFETPVYVEINVSEESVSSSETCNVIN